MRADRMQQAVLALASNRRASARSILRELITENPHDEQAWLLLAESVDQREQAIDCLERALRINPQNQIAREKLAVLKGELKAGVLKTRPENKSITPAFEPNGPHAEDQSLRREHLRRRLNWPLITGAMLVVLTLVLAYFGPSLARHDPLEMTTILRVGDKYITPPYPPGTPGYPLGSDGNGRDMLSRMLWGLRPTLVMVLIVAAIRLGLGTLIGMASGWSTGRLGRILDSLITAALSVPVIIVALGGIAAVGIDLGIWAFIFGLSITGWVETARIVREQTRAARGQVYVEAAQALGASNVSILLRHVLQQILSLLWMLFAFEISATLMLTAALGFLGYYIGGDVWVSVSDATAAAVSGAPELGQMLATSDVSFTKPWGLLVIGGLVFIIVLGFNLLGEGLRKQLSLYGKSGSTLWTRFMSDFRYWLDEHIAWPLSSLPRARAFRPALVLLASAILALAFYAGYERFTPSVERPLQESNLQTEHLWSSARRDPFGTRWVQAAGPASPKVTWTFNDDTGFSGGPAVARDGTIYIASRSGILYALSPQGKPTWQIKLPETPVGTPALSPSGEIYVSDERGGLSAIAAEGELLWRYADPSNRKATTSPVVAKDGSIYFGLQGAIIALNPQGKLIWEAHPASPNTAPGEMVQVSPNDELLFWGDVILGTADGSIHQAANLERPDQYFIGANGSIYQIEGHEVIQWNGDELDASSEKRLTWDYSKFTVARTPEDAGAAPDGVIWLFYTGFARGFGFGEDTRMVWLDEDGEMLGNSFHPIRNSQVIGVDEDHTLYACGNLERGYGDPQCGAFSPDAEEALWTLDLEGSQEVAGGALIPGRLYIANQEGSLYAIGLPETTREPLQVVTEPTEQPSEAHFGEETGPTQVEASIFAQAGEPIGPTQGSSALIFEDASGFSGGPAVTADGTIYILSNAGSFYSLNPQGKLNWEVTLPTRPVGTPAVGSEGNFYLSDIEGALSAYTPSGELLWRFTPQGDLKATSGPTIGPDGNLYYTTVESTGRIQAVSPAGEEVWQADLHTSLFYDTPQASPDGKYIFFKNEVFDHATGERLDFNLDFQVDQFFAGEDGRNYLRSAGTVVEWQAAGTGISLAKERVLVDERLGSPNYANVSPQGVVWLQFNTVVMWFTRQGEALGVSSPRNSFLTLAVAIDRDFTVYTCGRRPVDLRLNIKPYCFALFPEAEQPTWESKLGDEWEDFSGSTLVPGVLYIATQEGHLYAIGGEQ